MPQKQNEVVFTEEIDSKITGLALVLTFLCIGIFLLLYPSYFGNALATKIIRWIFIIIGALGLLTELFDGRQKNKYDIKGVDNFFVGVILLGVWICLFIFFDNLWVNILNFIILLIGAFVIIQGSFQICYSAFNIIKSKEKSKRKITSEFIIMITKIGSFALIIIQLVKALQ